MASVTARSKSIVFCQGREGGLAQLFKQLNSYLHSQGLSPNISSNHYLTSTYGAAQNIDPTHHPDLQELIRQCTT